MSIREEVNSFMEGRTIAFSQADADLVVYLAGCTLAKVPGNQNWLEEKAVGGLP